MFYTVGSNYTYINLFNSSLVIFVRLLRLEAGSSFLYSARMQTPSYTNFTEHNTAQENIVLYNTTGY